MKRLLAIVALALLVPASAWADPVNINTADAATLARELQGIGPAKAEAIVQYRQQRGPFKTADELALVKGIGPKVIEKNRANIRVEALRRAAGPVAPGTSTRPAAQKPAR